MTQYDSPLADLVVLDLTRALAGPQAGMMLGDLGRPGDQGRVGDGRRHPRPGARPGPATRARGPARLDVLHVRQPQQGVDRPRPQGRRRPRRCSGRLGARAPTCCSRTSAPACSTASASRSPGCTSSTRGLVIGSISGFGHDGPEAGRAGYDQIAQGEGGLMSVTGVGEPTKVGVPIADLLAGMNFAYGVLAALHERDAHRPGPRRAHLPARRHRRRARLPGHPLDHRRRGAGPERVAPPGDRAVRHVRDGDVAGAGGRGVGGSVAEVRAGGRAGPGRPALHHQPRPGRPPRRARRRDRGGLRHPSRPSTGSTCCCGVGIPAGKVRSLDDVYEWEQTARRGCCSTSTTRPTGRSRSPARRSASRTTRSPAAVPSTCRRPSSTSTARRSGSGWTR